MIFTLFWNKLNDFYKVLRHKMGQVEVGHHFSKSAFRFTFDVSDKNNMQTTKDALSFRHKLRFAYLFRQISLAGSDKQIN